MNAVMLTPNKEDPDRCTHAAHTGFANAVDAEIYQIPPPPSLPFSGSIAGDLFRNRRASPPRADVYLYEYADVYHALPRLTTSHPDAIHLPIATHLVFGRSQFRYEKLRTDTARYVHKSFIELLFKRNLRRHADGIIAVSELVADYLRTLLAGIRPISVCEPYVQPGLRNQLMEISPDLESNTAVVVCESREHKGIDILVKAWPMVRESVADAQLRLVGDGHPTEYDRVPGVDVLGYVDDIARVYEDASLYVHPARVDGFAVSVVEAMVAAVPAIVTNTTGARSVVSELGEEFVAPPVADALADAITRYFSRSETERIELGRKSRDLAAGYTETSQGNRFREVFREHVDERTG